MIKDLRVPTVEIYTQPWCAFCARAKNLLESKGASYREIDAPQGSPERAEAIERSGGRTTVPQIFINGLHIGGSDELRGLERSGELDRLLVA
jgi:glutaredoxin 3